MVHSIVIGFALSAVGSLEVGSGLGGRVSVMGEEAIARSAASGDSKIATMGLFGFGLSFVTSYFVRLLALRSFFVVARRACCEVLGGLTLRLRKVSTSPNFCSAARTCLLWWRP